MRRSLGLCVAFTPPCILLLAAPLLVLAIVPAAKADNAAISQWSNGPLGVAQRSGGNGNGSPFCYFISNNEAGNAFQLSRPVDGTTSFHFTVGNDAPAWNNGGRVTLMIDGRGFWLDMIVGTAKNWLRGDNLNDDLRHALFNGYHLGVTIGAARYDFSLDGTASAITVLNRCGDSIMTAKSGPPPQPFVAAPPAAVPPTLAVGEAPLSVDGGVYLVNATINSAATLPLTLDSGAGDLSLPASLAMKLVQNGTLSSADYVGERIYITANGSRLKQPVYRLRSVTVGGITVNDVECSVGRDDQPPLLGQTFLGRFGSWSIDNHRRVLVLR
jgi:hypothetical protein